RRWFVVWSLVAAVEVVPAVDGDSGGDGVEDGSGVPR
nr:hypothetical protein [Tanacetum cinerariifolium]